MDFTFFFFKKGGTVVLYLGDVEFLQGLGGGRSGEECVELGGRHFASGAQVAGLEDVDDGLGLILAHTVSADSVNNHLQTNKIDNDQLILMSSIKKIHVYIGRHFSSQRWTTFNPGDHFHLAPKT